MEEMKYCLIYISGRTAIVFRPDSDKSQFLAQVGFTRTNPDALEHAIREMVATYNARLDRQDRYGNFYRVEGILRGINGSDVPVVTIWIIRTGEHIYRFVTLKPWRKTYDTT